MCSKCIYKKEEANKDRQRTYKRNSEERRYGRVISITYSVCVCVCVCSLSYLARKAHVSYYFVIRGLFGCTILFHVVS